MSDTTGYFAPYIDATGIHVPSFAAIQAYLVAQYQDIYGADTYLGNDSQDGQLIGIFASMLNDANSLCVAAYNSRSPTTARGVGLDAVVQNNGIKRDKPAYSTQQFTLVGDAFTEITNGQLYDAVNGAGSNVWALPSSVVIPETTTITVTGTQTTFGALTNPNGAEMTIATPQAGWASATSASAVSLGAPVEQDGALRSRQAVSTALPSRSIDDGILGAIQSLPNVTRAALYDNDTDVTDGNGIPAHSFSVVVVGGDETQIASTILLKKGPGAQTFGTTAVVVNDAQGIPRTVRFTYATPVTVIGTLTLTPLAGYTSGVGADMQSAVAAAVNALSIGQSVARTRLFGPAYNLPDNEGLTFELTDIQLAASGGTPSDSDVTIAYSQYPVAVASGFSVVA